jgi:hypothetical protein
VGDFVVREVQVIGESFEGLRCLNGVEILALDVFDKGKLKELIVGEVLDNHRHLLQSCHPSGAQPAFTCDKLKAFAMAANDEWLDNAVSFDGFGKLADASLIELGARLQRVGIDIGDGDFANRAALIGRGCLGLA